MRIIWIGLFIAVTMLSTSVARAEDGTHATMTMTTTIDMGDMMPPDMAGPDVDEPMVFGGDIWLDDTRMRMEMDFSSMEGMGPMGPSITIMDLDENVMYMIDPDTKTALRHDLAEYQEMAGGIGGDMMNPASMFQGFDGYVDSIKDVPGVDYTILDSKTISGHLCQGMSYTVDMEKMMAEMDTDAPGGEMMGMMGDMSGVVWFSEDVGMMPVSMTTAMEMMGMSMNMEMLLNDIEDWTVTDSTFAVPKGYTIEDFEMPDMSEMPEMPTA